MSVIERMFESSRKSFDMTDTEIGMFWIAMLIRVAVTELVRR